MPRETGKSVSRKKEVLLFIQENADKGGVDQTTIREHTKEVWGSQIGSGNLRAILLEAITKGELLFWRDGEGRGASIRYFPGPQWGKVVKWLRTHGVEVEGGKPVAPKAPKETPREKIEREKLEAKKAEEEEARLHPDFHSCHTVFCNLWARHAGECQQHRRGYADSNNDWIIDEDGRRPWFPGWKGAVHED